MVILFQGDSITDTFRDRNNDANLGNGYPFLVQAELGFDSPGKFTFLNRGISGNRIVDLYARIKVDFLALKPDVLSILIGVNDVWHEFGETPNGVDAEKFYKIYSMLIEEIKETLPNTKIMVMEPFTLKGYANERVWDEFDRQVKLRAQKARLIANAYGLTFVPLQDGFDRLCEQQPSSYWLYDGVHPTPMGHEYIKRCWLKAFESLR